MAYGIRHVVYLGVRNDASMTFLKNLRFAGLPFCFFLCLMPGAGRPQSVAPERLRFSGCSKNVLCVSWVAVVRASPFFSMTDMNVKL